MSETIEHAYKISATEPLADVKHHLIKKAWQFGPKHEEQISKRLYAQLHDLGEKQGVFETEFLRWDELKPTVWQLMFQGEDKQTGQEQLKIIENDPDSKLDPDEAGMAFIYMFADLNSGKIFKILTEAIQ